MPNKVEQLDGGKVRVEYETGEKFEGDPIEVMNKIADAHVSTKRWSQNIKAENENLKNQQLNPPAPPPPPQPVNQDEKALQEYLLDQQAKALGFSNGDEYRKRVQFVNNVAEKQSNDAIAMDFINACPEFPNTNESVEKLASKVESLGWDYNQQSLMAAHLMCMREGAYKALTPEEMNAAWAGQMQQASGTAPTGSRVPPTPPQGGAPSSSDNTNPWTMSQDELRKKVLEGGGLGKMLMDLPPGGSL